jgi:hypothetical protein
MTESDMFSACENPPVTRSFVTEPCAHIDNNFNNRDLLAESASAGDIADAGGRRVNYK